MGKLLTLAVVALLALIVGKGVCGFLSVNSPVGGEFLVVEAWMPADAYREAVNQFRQGRYRKIIATAMMKDDPRVIVDRREDFGKRQLISFGIPSDLVVTVASEQVHRDRTFHSAMAVKRWLQAQHLETGSPMLSRSDPMPADRASCSRKLSAMTSKWASLPSPIAVSTQVTGGSPARACALS